MAPCGYISSWSTRAVHGVLELHTNHFPAWLQHKRGGRTCSTASPPTSRAARLRFAPRAPWYVCTCVRTQEYTHENAMVLDVVFVGQNVTEMPADMKKDSTHVEGLTSDRERPCYTQASRLRQDWALMPGDLPPQPPSRCSSAPTRWPVQGMWQSNCLQVACSNACTQQNVVSGNMCQAACGVC